MAVAGEAVTVSMVWALSGEPIAAMACTPADTVASLRGELELQTGLVGPWRLLLGDRLLRDPWTLHSMGISEGSIVHVARSKPHLVSLCLAIMSLCVFACSACDLFDILCNCQTH